MVNLSGFDLNLLRVLDALLRERSTVRAGERLGLSQPAVSAALGRLRHALGDPLFVRQGQGMVPTVFAQGLETPLRQALDGLELLLRGPGGFDPQAARFDFRVSASDYFGSMLMPVMVRRLADQAPGVRLQLVDLVPDNYVEPLDRHAVDLALIPQGDFPAWVDSAPLFRAEFVTIARAGHPALAGIERDCCLPLDLFCALDHVLCSPEGRFSGMGDAALARLGRSRRVAVSVPFFEAVLSIVAGSDMIALVPQDLAQPHMARGEITCRPLPFPMTPPELCMIWHRRLTRDPAHRWMRAQVAEILRTDQPSPRTRRR
ncbi:MAG: LysR family transcriptional regulator [Pararhodobacter sp.]|nr:LysR family transcriptional regulator [Pararhodobacter sp.]